MNYQVLWRRLAQVYDEGEAKAIARMVYEVRYGLRWSDVLMGRDADVPQDELEEITQRLERHEPIQYVLGKAEFMGKWYGVKPEVLIPRPETEELVRWMLSSLLILPSSFNILDIGTGTGCIAITLAAELPHAKVTAWDISDKALKVARENAKRHHVHVSFEQVDILNSQLSTINYQLSTIVSNPPYICNKEREAMEQNVLNFEPHTALFVPDDDPLLFYRTIADFAMTALTKDGWLYFEINPLYANELHELLSTMSWHDIEIKNDQFGKQRFIRAQR